MPVIGYVKKWDELQSFKEALYEHKDAVLANLGWFGRKKLLWQLKLQLSLLEEELATIKKHLMPWHKEEISIYLLKVE